MELVAGEEVASFETRTASSGISHRVNNDVFIFRKLLFAQELVVKVFLSLLGVGSLLIVNARDFF